MHEIYEIRGQSAQPYHQVNAQTLIGPDRVHDDPSTIEGLIELDRTGS